VHKSWGSILQENNNLKQIYNVRSSQKLTLGFLTVSSTLKIRQAASVAAFKALICKSIIKVEHHLYKR